VTINRLGLLAGTAFGFLLSGSRLTDYDVIHRMLLFRDWQPFLIMGSAVAVAAPLLWVLQLRRWATPLGGPLHLAPSAIGRHHVQGSILFGAGWAIAGTCPGPALAMIGSGRLPGICVVAGIFAGIALRDAVVAQTTRSAQAALPGMDPLRAGL
jgi:uncharacterized protein